MTGAPKVAYGHPRDRRPSGHRGSALIVPQKRWMGGSGCSSQSRLTPQAGHLIGWVFAELTIHAVENQQA